MKRKGYIISILALALFACEVISFPPLTSPDAQLQEIEGVKPPDAITEGRVGMTRIEVENALDFPICYVYIAESPSAPEGTAAEWAIGWGESHIPEGQTLAQGDSLSDIILPSGLYDIKFEDCDHNVLAWNFFVEIHEEDITITAMQSSDYLVVVNASSEPICTFRMLPGEFRGWGGRSLINEEDRINPGESRTFYDPMEGMERWNLLAENCSGYAIERFDVSIRGRTEWTIVDSSQAGA